jgi:hypothetical protein
VKTSNCTFFCNHSPPTTWTVPPPLFIRSQPHPRSCLMHEQHNRCHSPSSQWLTLPERSKTPQHFMQPDPESWGITVHAPSCSQVI